MTRTLRLPALDPMSVTPRRGSSYPAPFREPVEGRVKQVLGDPLGLTGFGANLVRLEPGAWSSQRHWHSHEDEFVLVLEGELTLVTDEGETLLGPGMAAGFPAGAENGHHLVNRGGTAATYLEIGDRRPRDEARYPDIDLMAMSGPDGRVFTNKKGEPY
jgi:uncharacterized cupin superfamily protein